SARIERILQVKVAFPSRAVNQDVFVLALNVRNRRLEVGKGTDKDLVGSPRLVNRLSAVGSGHGQSFTDVVSHEVSDRRIAHFKPRSSETISLTADQEALFLHQLATLQIGQGKNFSYPMR